MGNATGGWCLGFAWSSVVLFVSTAEGLFKQHENQPPLGKGEYYQVFMSPIEPQICFRIHDDLFFACETFFKQRIPRSKRYSIVSTLDNQVGVGARCLHLLEPGSMMTQKIRPGQGIEGGKDLAGNEGTHVG